MSIIKTLLIGFGCGAAATVPMTGAFWIGRHLHTLDEVPPHKAIRSVTAALSEPNLTLVSAFAHLAIGGSAGAAYTLMTPRRFLGAATGAALGIMVWAMGYEVVMPAATDIAPAHRDRRGRALTILIAHIIFGITLGRLSARAAAPRTKSRA